MIKLRTVSGPTEVYEAPPTLLVREVDGLHYLTTGKTVFVGRQTELQSMKEFDIVEVDLGFDDIPGAKRIMMLVPEHQNYNSEQVSAKIAELFALEDEGRVTC